MADENNAGAANGAVDCLSCSFTEPVVLPGGAIDFSRKVCRRFPPTPIPVMTPQGQQLGIAQPTVGKGVWCWEHPVMKAKMDSGRGDG